MFKQHGNHYLDLFFSILPGKLVTNPVQNCPWIALQLKNVIFFFKAIRIWFQEMLIGSDMGNDNISLFMEEQTQIKKFCQQLFSSYVNSLSRIISLKDYCDFLNYYLISKYFLFICFRMFEIQLEPPLPFSLPGYIILTSLSNTWYFRPCFTCQTELWTGEH